MKSLNNICQRRAITMDCQDYSTVGAEGKKGQHLGMAERGAIKALKQHGLGTRAITMGFYKPK